MGMAKMAKAPVLLVGDIDRGGVFAQLYGTVELLEEDERKMIKGLIINKFRGDKTILDPGVEMLESKCRIPVVGVAPYLNIQVEDEDSLTERFDRPQEVGMIDMAVIRVPRISISRILTHWRAYREFLFAMYSIRPTLRIRM